MCLFDSLALFYPNWIWSLCTVKWVLWLRITLWASNWKVQNLDPLKMLEKVCELMFRWSSVRYMYVCSISCFQLSMLKFLFTDVSIKWKWLFILQLLKDGDISVVEILKLDVVSSVYIPLQVCDNFTLSKSFSIRSCAIFW